MWKQGWRDTIWAELDRPWDVIIIGGGITGAGILREASRIGLRALLLERRDFAAGTSSRSSKLVHGGLRYLRNGQIRTTMASVHERERLLREGKGLITPLGFLFANYARDRQPAWLFGLGLIVYDLLGLHWGHKHYDAEGVQRLVPALAGDGLQGGYRYFDAQTDDARLVLRLLQESLAGGGQALSYAQVESLLQLANGAVRGVLVRDMAPEGCGRTAEAEAKVVINATGDAADCLRSQVGGDRRLRRLRGSHLVFPATSLPVNRAISFAHPVDQRPVFALPWEGVTLFGTTDVDHQQDPELEPSISSGEVDYLLTAIRCAFPDLDLDEADVQAAFSGVRAVVDTGKADPSKESREHVIWQENGLLTVTGGKLTTFRVMAHDALRTVRAKLPGEPRFSRRQVLDQPEELPAVDGLDRAMRLRLAGRYGNNAMPLVAAAGAGEMSQVAGSVALWAELRWGARAEAVTRLDDLLLRRVRLGLLLPEGGLPWMDQIRPIVQPEMGWDDARWRTEMAEYARRWSRAYTLSDR